MISIACTNCQTVLTIDDAFAGGVCRCQHCGTIQTVPSHLKATARAEAPDKSLPGSKTLYQQSGSADGGDGLDELAGAIASSGLNSSRLRASTATVPYASKRKAAGAGRKRSPLPLIISGAVVLAAIVAFAILYFMRSAPTPAQINNPSPATTPQVVENPSPAPVADDTVSKPSGPSFCGVPLTENSVVYVLDRGSATEQYFDALKAAFYHSLELMGPTRKFAVILSANGSPDFAYPKSGLADATADELQKIRGSMDDEIASGASKLRPALEQAAERHPAVIIVVTAKWTIDSDDAQALKESAQRGIRVHTFMLGGSDAVDPLQQAASLSGGVFKQVSDTDLRNFGS